MMSFDGLAEVLGKFFIALLWLLAFFMAALLPFGYPYNLWAIGAVVLVMVIDLVIGYRKDAQD